MAFKCLGLESRQLSGNGDSGTHRKNLISAIQSGDVEVLKDLLNDKDVELVDFQNLTVLHLSCRWGNAETCRALLEDKRVLRFLDHQMYNGDTPMVTAARYGNVGAVCVLIDFGADMEKQKSDTGNTVLHFAARIADCDLMNILLNRNPSLKFINTTNVAGETAVEVALKEHSPTVQVLLQAGAEFSQPNKFDGRNLLHTSVAYNQCGILRELLSSGISQRLVDLADHRGDTPLMLAIRVACFECVKSLINFKKICLEVNENTQESIIHIAVQTDEDEILKYILMHTNEELTNHRDANGMTPLLLAIEHNKDKCLKILIKSKSVYIVNNKSRETVLHAAIRVDNHLALSALLKPHNKNATLWCFNQENKEGNTPFWAAIESGHARFLVEARKRGWVSIEELNRFGDSPTFVAAARGHIQVLKVLLLSESYFDFCREHDGDQDLIGNELIRTAEICCDIYSSDIFILTNKTRKNKFHAWIPKTFLRNNNKTGQNIFHACALGGNVCCLDFVYKFCKLFNFDLSAFDSPDNNADTPLLLATRNDVGGPDCVYFFLTNGANISSINSSGDFVLKSLLVNTENAIPLLQSVLNESIFYDVTTRGLQEDTKSLKVNYCLFKPPNEPITKVVKLFYETIQGPQRTKLLQHTLFKTYINIIILSVNYFFLLRFIVSCLATLLLTIYLIFYSSVSSEHPEKLKIVNGIRYTLGMISVVGMLFSVPLLFHEVSFSIGVLMYTLMLLPCSSVIILILIPSGSELSFEIAAVTVLVSWLSLMMYSTAIFKEISHQIAMLSQVINGMMIYFRIVLLTLLPFALTFYCIFSDSFYFVTPFKSLIYTSFVLLQGDTLDSFDYFETKHSSLSNSSVSASARGLSYIENQVDFFLESSFIVAFTITCILGLMNMLVGLAVRDGKTLADDGEVFRRRLQIHWLYSLEAFLQSFIYKVLRHTPLIFLFGIIPSKTFIDVKMKYAPMTNKDNILFPSKSVIEMKRSVGPRRRKSTVKESF